MSQPTIKTIWGIAKSQELNLDSEELHLIAQTHTGKDSLKKLTQREIRIVVDALLKLKDSSQGTKKGSRGNPNTERQRRKIEQMAAELGWTDPVRVNGFCRKMFGVDRIEWLNYQQCSKLIEALKSMIKRKKEKSDEGLQPDY